MLSRSGSEPTAKSPRKSFKPVSGSLRKGRAASVQVAKTITGPEIHMMTAWLERSDRGKELIFTFRDRKSRGFYGKLLPYFSWTIGIFPELECVVKEC
jgi:hypothetical protein